MNPRNQKNWKVYFAFILLMNTASGFRKYTKDDVLKLREEVREMFTHAYDSYLRHAYPYDELRPLSCDGVDTWGSYSLTLIDALDTLAVIGNFTEFRRVVQILTSKPNFDANINVSVFETNIRIVGGLLSAHLLSHRAGLELEPGWPCNGPLLRLAEDVARRLLPAFDTPTGMPYGTVNLRHGVPPGETTVTCTAGVGTFILEFGTLSRLTGDPVYEEVALNALYALRHYRSTLGLVGNHIDVATGRWTALDAGIGAGVDSYYEYLAKGAMLLQRPELMKMFEESRVAIDRHLKRDDWHLWVTMTKGQVTLPVFQSLEAYWPGLLSIVGDISTGMKSLHNYHQVWKQYGFTPEFYNIPQAEAGTNREGYPLRPELAESVMYLSRATGDPFLLEVGVDILRSIQHSARTPCGYATIKDTRDHRQDDRMESFFLAETTKYLYLTFDPENFIHNRGQHGTVVKTHWGECVLDAGGYVFNTEAHPIDPAALHCCSETRDHPFVLDLDSFRGETLQEHQQRMEKLRLQEREQLKQKAEQMVQITEVPLRSCSKEQVVLPPASTQPKTAGSDSAPVTSATPTPISTAASAHTSGSYQGEAEIVGVGEVVNVEWHGKHSDGVVWHTKTDVVATKDSDNTIKQKDIGNGNFVGYRTGNDHIRPKREGDTEMYADDADCATDSDQTNRREVCETRSDKDDKENLDRVEQADSETEKAVLTEPPSLLETQSISSIFGSLFTMSAKEQPQVTKAFDPQDLLMKIQKQPIYAVNVTWQTEYSSLSCSLQPFLQRVSMSGEFFSNT